MAIGELSITMNISRTSEIGPISRPSIYRMLSSKINREYTTRIDSNTVNKIMEISKTRVTY
ncbi:MAG: hypothetical protein QXU18_13280 [Thermoplasmatales archaeon]